MSMLGFIMKYFHSKSYEKDIVRQLKGDKQFADQSDKEILQKVKNVVRS